MGFTAEELNGEIRELNSKILEPIRIDRGRRYGSSEDTLANVRGADPEGSWRGAYTSAVECMNRLKNYYFTKTCEMSPEQIKDFENACEDLVNYSFYIWILFNQKLDCKCRGDNGPPD